MFCTRVWMNETIRLPRTRDTKKTVYVNKSARNVVINMNYRHYRNKMD